MLGPLRGGLNIERGLSGHAPAPPLRAGALRSSGCEGFPPGAPLHPFRRIGGGVAVGTTATAAPAHLPTKRREGGRSISVSRA
eukprot:11556832-Alexandrium_andersonii.AAC.1